MPALLEIRGLHAAYGSVRVLDGIDMDLAEGRVTALLGANGAGKTTTLRAICRHLVDTRGEVRLAGERIDRHSTERIARQGVGHVPDGRGTFAQLSAEDNLRLGAQARPTRAARADVGGDMERMFGYFPRLRERRTQQAGTLSGGEQQMLAIARALMGRPRLLLLDEPSFGLAPLVVRDIFGILRRINAEQGTTILLVEQNARLALELAHSAYLLETGRIVLHGPSEAMRRNDAVRQAYLGE
ncbi:ABC transporter ATP-binding protein [Delftia sp. WSY_4]|jgi:branched-chain amino acid transport system ATP-binding protein|uniref:ABC transporter related n=2 Tax=Delftia acidovorans TaxID=80866 RepID=A9BMA3_DELAS|nr:MULTISPECIES: ABC transporter ATP-binding protein [Delftia]MBA4005848.1 ABC transporter ATP-binding protein [Delftia sp.]OLE95621.1 MAG: ABC transporter ATP-binding protein [Delftia sp. 13_1_40CM_3_66_6]PIF36707.1 amino acid/amide ABC transporter ATP-binding protein 2 (HAAT family) [Burkholderiales bacterium 23]ABX37448.1 ABC transporter related [Delftia acidovorans SPH-1]MCP4018980.1 ABC transporter ATP-binding protein [Delftia sp.]